MTMEAQVEFPGRLKISPLFSDATLTWISKFSLRVLPKTSWPM